LLQEASPNREAAASANAECLIIFFIMLVVLGVRRKL